MSRDCVVNIKYEVVDVSSKDGGGPRFKVMFSSKAGNGYLPGYYGSRQDAEAEIEFMTKDTPRGASPR